MKKNTSPFFYKNIISELDALAIAKETGFSKRPSRKITPLTFFAACCLRSMGSCFSFSFLAGTAGFITDGKSISKQAFWKRMNNNAEKFMEKTLLFILKKKIKLGRSTKNINKCKLFNRILIQDSTSIRVSDKFFDIFKGSANQCKKNCNLKIQTVVNILKYDFIDFAITPYFKNDQKAAPDLEFITSNDLIIRDLGYFVIPALKSIIAKKAFFISRLRYGTSIYSALNDQQINLLSKLKKNKFLDIDILLSKKYKLPVRLIAIKLPESVVNQRRRKLRSTRDASMNPSKEHFEWLGWSIYITNIDKGTLNSKEISDYYSLRWETEISIIKLFKFIAENQFIFLTKNCLFCSPLDFIHIISKVTSYETRNRNNMKQKIKKILFTNP